MKYLMRPAPPLLSDLVAERLAKGSATRKELCEELGVSRTSLGRAISDLLSDGSFLSSCEEKRTMLGGSKLFPIKTTPRPLAQLSVQSSPNPVHNVALEQHRVKESAQDLPISSAGQLSAPGRPVQKLILNTHVGYRVGIDISRIGCCAVVLNRAYKEILRVESDVREGEEFTDSLKRVCSALYEESEARGLNLYFVSKVGIGIPVPINEDSQEYLEQKILIENIVSAYWRAPILIENTVRLGAIGEARWGAGRGISSQFYVRLSGGVGCCLAISDTITGGEAGYAGEFGHVQVPGFDLPCRCGKRGCVETIASESAVCAAAGVDSLNELRIMLNSGDENSKKAYGVLEKVGRVVGEQIAVVVLIANPQIVVCAGSLVAFIPEIIPLIASAVEKYLPPVLSRKIPVVQEVLGHRGSSLGAAFAADFAVESHENREE